MASIFFSGTENGRQVSTEDMPEPGRCKGRPLPSEIKFMGHYFHPRNLPLHHFIVDEPSATDTVCSFFYDRNYRTDRVAIFGVADFLLLLIF